MTLLFLIIEICHPYLREQFVPQKQHVQQKKRISLKCFKQTALLY